jgi:hypothetical protein
MKNRPKQPFVPAERHESIRRDIIALLEAKILSAREISGEIRVPEKEVYEHLEHIRKTLNNKALQLIIRPSECTKCGFIFRKRDRLKKPGKCPVCKGESVQEPLFSVKAAQ